MFEIQNRQASPSQTSFTLLKLAKRKLFLAEHPHQQPMSAEEKTQASGYFKVRILNHSTIITLIIK